MDRTILIVCTLNEKKNPRWRDTFQKKASIALRKAGLTRGNVECFVLKESIDQSDAGDIINYSEYLVLDDVIDCWEE